MKFRLFSNVHWSDKLVDVLVVVLGITIAFWLNNWQSERKNSSSEQKYLAALQTDLAKDTVQLLEITKEMDTIFFAIERMLRLADKPENADSVADYLSLISNDINVFFPEDYTYKSLQQSGDIGLIQNDSLLLILSDLYDYYEHINVMNELAYEYQLRNLLPYFDNYDLRREKVFSRKVYNNHIFDAHLIRYRRNLINRQKWINEAMEKHRTLQRLIREELAD
jgi:hypothetical protein